MRSVFIFACWLLSITYAAVPQGISDNAIADSVKQTLDQLGGFAVESRDPVIPLAARPLLTTLKHELRDLLLSKMNDESIHWSSADELRSQVLSSLRKAGVIIDKPAKDQDSWKEEESRKYFYNDIQRIFIGTPASHPDFLIATTTLWVMCGEDTSFYLFRRIKGSWHLILAQEASNYPDIAGAQAYFGYAISPLDRQGNFFVVTADVNPWCTSNWQRLRYAVALPGRTPYEPEILLQRSETIYLGVAPPIYTLTVKPNSFRLAFRGDWYWNADLGASNQFAEYRVTRRRVSLIKRGKVK